MSIGQPKYICIIFLWYKSCVTAVCHLNVPMSVGGDELTARDNVNSAAFIVPLAAAGHSGPEALPHLWGLQSHRVCALLCRCSQSPLVVTEGSVDQTFAGPLEGGWRMAFSAALVPDGTPKQGHPGLHIPVFSHRLRPSLASRSPVK